MKGTRKLSIVLAGAVTLTACSGTSPGAPAGYRSWHQFDASMAAYERTVRTAAALYLREHPVPSRPWMTAGIVVDYANPRGDPERNWAQKFLTASGKTLTIFCGSTQDPCRRPPPGVCKACTGPGGIGTYEYVPANGNIARARRVTVIAVGAVNVP